MKIPGKVSTNVRIDEVLWAKMKLIAENENRSTNAQLEMFIKKSISDYEAENGSIIIPVSE